MKHISGPRARWRAGALVSSVALLASAAFIPTAVADDDDDHDGEGSSAELREDVEVDGIMKHLQALQDIADANGGTRASGTPGYKASVDYIVKKLKQADYKPVVQEFDFPFYRKIGTATFEQVSPASASYVDGTDFVLMTYSGSGDLTAPVQGVDLALANPSSSSSGCEASDFAGFTAGNIALIQRGTCSFAQKHTNAENAGAKAVIVFNQGTPGRTDAFAGTLGSPVATVPSLGTSFAIGQALAADGATARIAATTESAIRKTWNVHAETEEGSRKRIVQAGAHLDSVVPGPGINDNGSGSAALLEVAEQMEDVDDLDNRVRFSWWGAEELGLLGSNHYINDLSANAPDKLALIKLYLNFDMVGSPNYGLFVYDGDNSAFPPGPGAAVGPEGSGAIEALFHDYFESQGLPSAETPFSGRSDYGPFIAKGIPAGGLFTGAEGVKTAEQAALFGGTAGEAYDSCYHLACDNISNVSRAALDANSDAIAHAVYTYAMSLEQLYAPVEGGAHGEGTDSGGGLHPDHDHDHEGETH